MYFPRFRPVLNGLGLHLVHRNAIGSNDVTQEVCGCRVKLTLFRFRVKFVKSELLEYFAHLVGCLCGSSVKMRMSSRYMTTQTSSMSANTLFMKRWNDTGPLQRPKCMTKNSKEP